jgi:hypothetical protein
VVGHYPSTDERDWYTASEVAAMWRRSPQAIYLAARTGRLPKVAIARGKQIEWRFPKDEIDGLDRHDLPRVARSMIPQDRGSLDADRTARAKELRDEIRSLQVQLNEERIKWALAEQKVDELTADLDKANAVIGYLAEAVKAGRAERSYPS